jgi:hypothetical protein
MRAIVSFLELEPEEVGEESEDLEQPVRKSERIKQEITEKTERGRENAIILRPLTPALSPSDGEREIIFTLDGPPR